MTESTVVNRWVQEARDQARIEEAREILVRLVRRRFPTVVTDAILGAIDAQPSLHLLHDWCEAAVFAVSPEEFLAVLRR